MFGVPEFTQAGKIKKQEANVAFDGSKPGPGRPKGSANKNTQLMREWAEKNGQAWIDMVWGIASNAAEKTPDRLQALSLIGKKAFPDLKNVETQVETGPQKIEIRWGNNEVVTPTQEVDDEESPE